MPIVGQTQTQQDELTHVTTVLANVQAVIEGRATSDQQAYTIAGRSLQKMPIADLLMLRDRYKSELRSLQAAANIAAGLGSGRKIRFRF